MKSKKKRTIRIEAKEEHSLLVIQERWDSLPRWLQLEMLHTAMFAEWQSKAEAPPVILKPLRQFEFVAESQPLILGDRRKRPR